MPAKATINDAYKHGHNFFLPKTVGETPTVYIFISTQNMDTIDKVKHGPDSIQLYITPIVRF